MPIWISILTMHMAYYGAAMLVGVIPGTLLGKWVFARGVKSKWPLIIVGNLISWVVLTIFANDIHHMGAVAIGAFVIATLIAGAFKKQKPELAASA